MGIHHVAVGVADLDGALAFYRDVLGGTEIPRPEFGVPGHWLDLGGGQVHLFETSDPAARQNHVAIRVADLDAAVVAVREAGAEVFVLGETFPGAGAQAFVNDPFGNLVELNQPIPG